MQKRSVEPEAEKTRTKEVGAESKLSPVNMENYKWVEAALLAQNALESIRHSMYQMPSSQYEFMLAAISEIQKLWEIELKRRRREYENPAHSQECALRYITAEQAAATDYGCTCGVETGWPKPDTLEYWKARAETAELKVLTFNEEIAKLRSEEEVR